MNNFWVSTKMNKYIFTLEEKEIITSQGSSCILKIVGGFFFSVQN